MIEDYPCLESDHHRYGFDPVEFEVTLLEPRPFRPFKSSEEYLYAMKEDLAEWLNGLYEGLDLTADTFLEQMETGVVLCQHANNVVRKAREYYRTIGAPCEIPIPERDVVYRMDVLPETFHARDNVSNFISWCRALSIKECLLFETDDLVLRKNERSFILCLLEVARRGTQFGMPAPLLVQFEQEIDAELANDDGYLTTMDHHQVQVVTNDLRSLHERVVELLSRCTCPSQFPMIRVADGKYRIGDTKVLIFVRILRTHVMVRVGGGWDTLEHYLDKHDPCRCRSGHRLATSAKLTMYQGKSSIPSMHVTYNRPQQSITPTSSPIVHRRSVTYGNMNPYVKQERIPSPIRHHQHQQQQVPQCSDDSSSNPSLHEANTKPKKSKKSVPQVLDRRHSVESTSDDLSEDDDRQMQHRDRSPTARNYNQNRRLSNGTAPSSWSYTSGVTERRKSGEMSHPPPVKVPSSKKLSPPAMAIRVHTKQSTRLPSLTVRCQNQSPPRVVKVPSNVPCPSSKWDESKSQSTEDLYPETTTSVPKLIFHSRGTSPVNMKGRSSSGGTAFSFGRNLSVDSYRNSDGIDVNNFRRGDPVRHSSYHSPRNYNNKKCSPRLPPKLTPSPMVMGKPIQPQNGCSDVTNGGMHQERQKATSPILKRLLQRSDLCADENFLRKIEMLILEYESKDPQQEAPRSLPADFTKCHSTGNPRRSPRDSFGRVQSKIPVPAKY